MCVCVCVCVITCVRALYTAGSAELLVVACINQLAFRVHFSLLSAEADEGTVGGPTS